MSTIKRTEPVVVVPAGRHATTSIGSRLPAPLKIGMLILLNFGLRTVLWTFAAETLLTPELGAISKVPNDDEWFSLYSPGARIAMSAAINYMNWYLNYDFYDAAALTVLINTPYTYLIATYYEISLPTVFAHIAVEVLAIAIPTYLLRARSAKNDARAPLRNRFLLNSVQVTVSNSLLAMGVYIVVIWGGLKTGRLIPFLVSHFDIDTLHAAYLETPVSLLGKIFIAGVAAKDFLLKPSIAAEPLSGTATPEQHFNPATATLDQTIKANVLPRDKRMKTLVQQTLILNAFTFAGTVQRCMAIKGAEIYGAVGYASMWVMADTVIALWYAWVGDTSSDYEPL